MVDSHRLDIVVYNINLTLRVLQTGAPWILERPLTRTDIHIESVKVMKSAAPLGLGSYVELNFPDLKTNEH